MTRAEVPADVHQQIYALVQAQIDANDRALVESIAAGDLDIDDARASLRLAPRRCSRESTERDHVC